MYSVFKIQVNCVRKLNMYWVVLFKKKHAARFIYTNNKNTGKTHRTHFDLYLYFKYYVCKNVCRILTLPGLSCKPVHTHPCTTLPTTCFKEFRPLILSY